MQICNSIEEAKKWSQLKCLVSKNRIVDKVCYDHKIDYDIAVKNEQTAARYSLSLMDGLQIP